MQAAAEIRKFGLLVRLIPSGNSSTNSTLYSSPFSRKASASSGKLHPGKAVVFLMIRRISVSSSQILGVRAAAGQIV